MLRRIFANASTPSNIKWLYVITFLGECYLTNAVWLFFYLRYLSFAEITTLVVLQQLVQLVLEVPTGAIADMFGKKVTLTVSYGLYFVSLFLTPFFSTFWVFFILEFVKGVAKALCSGTQEALTYDSLKEAGKEGEYAKVNANLSTIAWVAFIPAGLLGGYLFDCFFYLPYIILAIFYLLITLIIAFYITEPTIDTVKGSWSLVNYLKQNAQGFKELFKNSSVGSLVIALLILSFGYYTASEYLGVSQGREYGLSATLVSIVFTAGAAVSALLSQVVARWAKRISHMVIALSASLFMLASYLLAFFVSPAVGILLIASRIGSRSTFENAKSFLLNAHISSGNRATALSTYSLLYTLPYVLATLAGGYVIDRSSVNQFAFLLGTLMVTGVMSSLLVNRFASRAPQT